MIKLFWKLLLLFPIFLAFILLNYYVDPANLFSNGYEKGIAQLWLNKKNVANISNYDERLAQKYYIDGITQKFNIVIIGQSSIMEIGSNFFPNSSVFNNSVSGASIEDMMAIYQMYREKNLLPDTLILGLSPWILNRNNYQTRWYSIDDEFFKICSIIGSQNYNSEKKTSFFFNNNTFYPNSFLFHVRRIKYKYSELFSLDYFQNSLMKIFKGSDRKYYATSKELEDSCAVHLYDGRWYYDKKYRNRSIYDNDLQSIENMANPYSLNNFIELDTNLQTLFKSFINLIIRDSVDVIFYLPPYYPKFYELLVNNPKYNIILNAQNYFINFAKQNKINIVGSYNPKNLDLNEIDFYDPLHPKESAMRKIFINICND